MSDRNDTKNSSFDAELVPYNKQHINLTKTTTKYYIFKTDTTYKIRLTNRTSCKTEALVKINDKIIGMWDIDPNTCIEINKPINTNKPFIFIRKDVPSKKTNILTRYGNSVLPKNMRTDNIEITFFPELSYCRCMGLATIGVYTPEKQKDFDNSMKELYNKHKSYLKYHVNTKQSNSVVVLNNNSKTNTSYNDDIYEARSGIIICNLKLIMDNKPHINHKKILSTINT